MKFLDRFKKKPKAVLPPVPAWQPEVVQPLDVIIDAVKCYSNYNKDFAIFQNGTIAILADGLSDGEGEVEARRALHKVYHSHPDMNPKKMKDGNTLIHYGYDVANVVLVDIAEHNKELIENRHQDALVASEILVTPLGNNVFNEFGQQSLFGRCFMFMDAQEPKVIHITRKSI